MGTRLSRLIPTEIGAFKHWCSCLSLTSVSGSVPGAAAFVCSPYFCGGGISCGWILMWLSDFDAFIDAFSVSGSFGHTLTTPSVTPSRSPAPPTTPSKSPSVTMAPSTTPSKIHWCPPHLRSQLADNSMAPSFRALCMQLILFHFDCMAANLRVDRPRNRPDYRQSSKFLKSAGLTMDVLRSLVIPVELRSLLPL